MAEISPLRRRMIEDMTIRNLSPATQQSYVHAVSKFSRYFGHSPDRLGLEDVRAYQVHLISKGHCHTNQIWPARRWEVPTQVQAAVAARHVWKASSRKTWSVRRDVRWRWTLKAFWTTA